MGISILTLALALLLFVDPNGQRNSVQRVGGGRALVAAPESLLRRLLGPFR